MQAKNNIEFQINDFIIYGSNSVCLVKDIGVPDIPGIELTRKYYFLQPLYAEKSIIYCPVDNPKTVMRRILTREETTELIRRIPFIDTLWIDNERTREEQYKKALRSGSCHEWIRIIKTLNIRNEERLLKKKPVNTLDERYLRMAETFLFDELAISLEMSRETVENYIIEQVHQLGSK
ncbi:MAG: CarD family transcriptional regulator [Syntrophomonas sp.]